MSFAGIRRKELDRFKGAVRSVFLEILVSCNHSDNPSFLFDNKSLPLKRGDWVTSLKTLSDNTGLSKQQIRTALASLSTLQILTHSSTHQLTNRARLITVTDIDKYLIKQNEQHTKQHTKRQAPNTPLTPNNKNNNNNKEIQIEEISFLGNLNWKRKRGDFINSPDRKKLEDYEKEYGKINWTNIVDYKKLKAK